MRFGAQLSLKPPADQWALVRRLEALGYDAVFTGDHVSFHNPILDLGKIRYNIEGLSEFEAEEGDVVYVPRQTWHLASFGGQEGLRSCRLAMNGFPYQAHMFEAD